MIVPDMLEQRRVRFNRPHENVCMPVPIEAPIIQPMLRIRPERTGIENTGILGHALEEVR
jgi:hypothetical protein